MDASIIIPTKNAGDNFPNLLKSIFSQKFDGNYEVIIIDSGSTDTTVEIAQSYPVKLIQINPQDFGHGRTRNLGGELSNGINLVYINQDALPANEHWLKNLTKHLAEQQIAMVVGKQIPWDHTRPPEKAFYNYTFPPFQIRITRDDPDYYRDNLFVSNVNSAIRKDIWKDFKFSERVLLAEDKELARRLLDAGWHIIYEPEAMVYHAHDYNLISIFKRGIQGGIAVRQKADAMPRTHRSLFSLAWDYISTEYKYLKSQRNLKWLPYCLLYDLSRFVGNRIGRLCFIKPEWLNK